MTEVIEVDVTERPRSKSSFPSTVLRFAAAAMTLWGCAAFDGTGCIDADWQSIGFEDGARGQGPSSIGYHREKCIGDGIEPDSEKYESGRRKGLLKWCTPSNGYLLGTQGKSSAGVCPGNLEPAFSQAIDRGRALHAYKEEVVAQEARLKEKTAELDPLQGDIEARKKVLANKNTSPLHRMTLLKVIRQLEQEKKSIIDDIAEMRLILEDMRANLQRMHADNPYR